MNCIQQHILSARRLKLLTFQSSVRSVNSVAFSTCLLVLLISVANAYQQAAQETTKTTGVTKQDVNALELGKPIERDLAGGQSHSYQIALTASQFLHVVVEQLGIDVVVTLHGPDDKKLAEVDSPNGTQGPEPLILIMESTGIHRLEVRSLEEKAAPGRYQARVEALRTPTEQDRQRVAELRELQKADELTDRVIELNDQGRYGEAIQLAERVVTIREKILGAEHADVAAALNNLATMYSAQGDFQRAARSHERALAIKEKALGPEHVSTATSLLNLAEVYRETGDFARAEPLYQRAVAIFEKRFGASHPRVADALNKLALFYDAGGDYSTAESLYLRALAIREKELGAEHRDTGISLTNLTDLYRETGDLSRAEEVGKRALAIFEKALGAEHPFFATSLNNLALVYVDKGDFRRAEALYQRALVIREKTLGAEHPEVATSLYNLAALYSREGDLARAEPLYQRILAIDEKAFGKEHPQIASDLNNVASLYESKGDLARAESLYQRALAISEKSLGLEHPQTASVLNNLSLLYYRKGDFVRAEPLGGRALAIREKVLGGEHPDVAVSLSNLAALYEAKGDAARAINFRSRGNDIREHNLSLILNTGSEKEKLLYLSTFADETDLTISLHTRSAPTNTEAIALALTTIMRRKGRVLDAMVDQVAVLRRDLDRQGQLLLTELSAVQTRLAGLVLRGPEKRDSDYLATVSNLEAESERLQASISSRSVRFRLQSRPVTIEQVQAAIPPGAALVEVINYTPYYAKTGVFSEARYVAYVLRGEGKPQSVDLGEAAKIDRDIAKLQRALGDPADISVKQAARELDEQVLRPVRQLLGGARHLLLSADGALNLVPFPALVDEQGHYLVENYTITYLTSGRDLLRYGNSPESKQGPVVIAAPLFDSRPPAGGKQDAARAAGRNRRRSADMTQLRFSPLPGTASEAKALSEILPGVKVLTRGQATEAALRRVTAPSILHIATHGFFLPDRPQGETARAGRPGARLGDTANATGGENPLLRSGLAFAGANMRLDESGNDGLLTALEAAGLDLWGTRLVVLSACETGLGEVSNGNGVYGLRRALVIAGAESQVISLWKVDDAATREVMTSYYKRLQRGEGRTEALRQAQRELLGRQKYKHPFYWAAFIQSGDWRGLDRK